VRVQNAGPNDSSLINVLDGIRAAAKGDGTSLFHHVVPGAEPADLAVAGRPCRPHDSDGISLMKLYLNI